MDSKSFSSILEEIAGICDYVNNSANQPGKSSTSASRGDEDSTALDSQVTSNASYGSQTVSGTGPGDALPSGALTHAEALGGSIGPEKAPDPRFGSRIVAGTARIRRKHNVLSLADKLEIIRKLECGVTTDSIARSYNIGRATVFDIKSKKKDLLAYSARLGETQLTQRRKIMRRANDESLEQAVFLWYKERTSHGMPVNGPMLVEKARELNRLMGGSEDFKASSGWLQNFKLRHGIATFNPKKARGGSAPEPEPPTDDYSFLEAFLHLLQQEGYEKEDIYTVDGLEFHLRGMPRRDFFLKHESPCTRRSLETITILAAANCDWTHALPLLVVGRSPREACFRGVRTLPIAYRCQERGVVDPGTFLEWFSSEFVPCVRNRRRAAGKGGKVLVLLQDRQELPPLKALTAVDELFQVVTFPPSLTPIAYTMDRAVLRNLLKLFKVQVLARLLMTAANHRDVVRLSRRVTLKDFSYMLADTWSTLAEEKARRLWAGPAEETDKLAEKSSRSHEREVKDVVEMCKSSTDLSRCDLEDIKLWLAGDRGDHSLEPEEGYPPEDDAEIITPVSAEEAIRMHSGEVQEDAEEEDPHQEDAHPTHLEASEALVTAIGWCEKQAECLPEQLIFLKRLKDRAEGKSRDNSDLLC